MLYVFHVKSFIKYVIYTYFLPDHSLSFYFCNGVLWKAEVLNFGEVYFINMVSGLGNIYLVQVHKDFIPCFQLTVL